MSSGKFATAINCIDGRIQQPVIEWAQKHLQVDYVDLITVPGPDKLLLAGNPHSITDIKERVQVSLSAHHSRTIIVTGHYDCAANPVPKEQHIGQITTCAAAIKSWHPELRVIGMWVGKSGNIEVVADK